MAQGPNVKKLIIRKMSLLMIPVGCKDPLVTGIEAIRNLPNSGVARRATAWVEEALRVIRTTAEPNLYKSKSDEELAGMLLKQIEEKEKARAAV